jgi:plasmid stability protein
MIMSVVHLPDELVERLAAEAARRGISVDDLATETLSSRFPGEGPDAGRDALEAFIGSGRSGRGDLGREHRQVLAEAFADKTARDL